MALGDILNNLTVQNLINDDAFIGAIVPKIAAGAGDNGVYTKTAADATLATKANVTGNNLTLPAFVTALAAGAGDNGVYTKTAADATLADKANVTGDNLTLPAFVTALAAGAGDNGVYTKTAADAALADKLNINGDNADEDGAKAILGQLKGNDQVVKINASNLTDAANQRAFAEAILPAKDGSKSILVGKLEGFLAENAKVYSNNTKTAKELLVPSATEIAAEVIDSPKFIVDVTDAKIKEIASQPSFEPPTSADAALNWTW